MTNQLPAYLQNRQSRGLAQTLVGNLGVGSPPYLSIMGNRLSLIDSAGDEIAVPTYDPKIGPYLDCMIVDALERTSKIFYDKPYDPNASQYEPPACFSDNGLAPSRNASKPQSATCASCPQAAWGSKVSAVSGKGVKACADIQKIAIVVPGYEMPFLLRVPPNSRTNLRGYLNKFVGQQIDVCDVITRVSFEQGVIGTLHFDAVGYIDEPTFAQREKLAAAHATDAMVGRTDLPRDGMIAASAQPAQIEHQVAPFFVPPAAPMAVSPATPPFPSPSATSPLPVQTTPPPVGGATAASPSEPRRRRRSAAEQPAQPQSQAAPFMPQQPVQQGAQPQANGNFGIQQGTAPNPDLQKTLDNLFGGPK